VALRTVNNSSIKSKPPPRIAPLLNCTSALMPGPD
jgi:hypothetical protein